MKHLSLLLLLNIIFQSSFSQNYRYRFVGDFNEASTGPALTEVLSCGAAPGVFTTQVLTTSAGTCGAGAQSTFDFAAGGGVSFPNNNLIGSTYTIQIFFRFNQLSGYRRVIDFLNGSTDVGLYILNNCLNFYPNGNVGTCPAFVPGNYYMLTLVRDGTSGNISIYLNGTSFGTYSDAANNYVPLTSTTPIVFFRDNIAANAQCENSDGSVKFISLSPVLSTAAEVNNTWTNVCALVLPVNFISFTGAKKLDGILLRWKTENESGISAYEIERSANGSNGFTEIGTRAANNVSGNVYTLTDSKSIIGTAYYRIKIISTDGTYRYSEILKFSADIQQQISVYPNPAKDNVMITGMQWGGTIRIYDAAGILMQTMNVTTDMMSASLEKYSPGMYIIEYIAGDHTERHKLLKY